MGMLGSAGRIAKTKTRISLADVTPNAVDWTTTVQQSTGQRTAMLQITGINQSITLRISWKGTGGTLQYSLQPTSTYGSPITLSSSPTNITVSNGQYLGFVLFPGAASTLYTRSVTVTNVTDNNTTLDTFTITVDTSP